MKVLLIQPPYRHGRDMLPTGLAYVAAYLLKAGHEVKVLDADAFTYTKSQLERYLTEEKYDVVGIGCLVTAYNFVLQVSNFIKTTKPEVVIVVGGKLASYSYDVLLKNSPVDYCVIGDGELTMIDLLSALHLRRDLKKVDGIAYKEDGAIIVTRPRIQIENLDNIPYPPRDLFWAKEAYIGNTFVDNIFKAGRCMNISGGRGCPYSCTFCSYDKKVRLRSAGSLIDELKMLKMNYGIRNFWFEDDLFMANLERVEDFCNRMIKDKLNLCWSASGRVNLVNKSILSLMKRAGCYTLGFGLESGSAEMLKRMNKFVTPEQNEYAIKITHEAGILPGGSWIIGMPGESRETAQMSIDLYKRINRYRRIRNEFFFATPYPGTELYKEMQRNGRITDEHEYMVRISTSGDAFKFVINCTDSFTDKELIEAKKNADYITGKDFYQKHPFVWLADMLWLDVAKKAIIYLKLNGPVKFCQKVLNRLTNTRGYP